MRPPHLTRLAPSAHYADVTTTSASDLRSQLATWTWWWLPSRVEVAVAGR